MNKTKQFAPTKTQAKGGHDLPSFPLFVGNFNIFCSRLAQAEVAHGGIGDRRNHLHERMFPLKLVSDKNSAGRIARPPHCLLKRKSRLPSGGLTMMYLLVPLS